MGKRKFHDPRKSRQVTETNEWVEQGRGQVFAPGTYVDSHGVLRAVKDKSVVVWHHRPRERATYGLVGSCVRRGIQPGEIAYDPATGAPWCPECWPHEQKRQAAVKKENLAKGIKKLFGSN